MIDPERYRRIDEIFQAALELDSRERASYMSQACGGDESLLKEVETLLASDEQQWELIGTPAFEMVAPLLTADQAELNAGDSIGHYHIVSLLGIGGMGQVYLAEDRKLGRKVALKLLPASYTRDESRLRRFQQEARAASALNHPNILTIHELGEVDGQQFIATEFVEGETLRELMKRAPLTFAETIDIAIQIAGALATAHKAGIVHRDIKPENLMLRHDGYVKVLDFGLAKLTEQSEVAIQMHGAADVNISSGLVMGTVKYMSPEQARGQQVDRRSDIFSFGVVLYEMVARRAPFGGKNSDELISAILKREPPPLTEAPAQMQRVIGKALCKKKEERYQTIEELLVDLKSLREDKNVTGVSAQTAARHIDGSRLATAENPAISTLTTLEYAVSGIKRHKTRTAAVVVASLVIVALGVTFGLNRLGNRLHASPRDVKIMRVPDLDKAVSVAISPNGEYIAYAERAATANSGRSLWVLNVSTNQREQIVPPANIPYLYLIYSPDGGEIFYNNDDVLYRIPAAGGQASKVLSGVGGAISFAPNGLQFAFVRELNKEETALMVANVDGTAERILARRKKPQFFSPEGPAWSPDGTVIVCAAGELAKNNQGQLIGIDAAAGEQKWATEAKWDEFSGRILWLSDGSGLIAAALQGADEQIWEIPYPAGEAHRITSDPNNKYWDLSLTADGKSLITIESSTRSAIWVAPDGNPGAAKPITSGEHHLYRNVAWTPDGRILYASNIGNSRDIWIMNGDGTDPKQLTANASINLQPAASADGRYVVLSSNRAQDGAYNLWRIDVDGSNPVQLTHGSGEGQPICSPDGRWVVYSQGGPNTTAWEKTLWKVSIDGGESMQLSDKPSSGPSISPDGTLIACWYAQEAGTEDSRPPLKMALIPSSGGAPINVLDAIGPRAPSRVRWTADGQAISYLKSDAGVSNIWTQAPGGGPPKQVTQFTSEKIEGFDWSRDGRLLCAREHDVGDVVLISNFK